MRPAAPARWRLQRLPKSTWRDVRYRGDPLLRPIASFEIGLLVRLLVALSLRLNAALGLAGGGGGRVAAAEQDEGEELVETRLQVRVSPWPRVGSASFATAAEAAQGQCSSGQPGCLPTLDMVNNLDPIIVGHS